MKLTHAGLGEQEKKFYDMARQVSAYAYAPYSKRQVGAAVRTDKNTVFRGCNVENVSYGLTCCAERNAIFAAVAAEGARMGVQEIAIYANVNSAKPCGACLQVIAEFGTNIRILFSDRDQIIDTTIAELLPRISFPRLFHTYCTSSRGCGLPDGFRHSSVGARCPERNGL